MFLFLGVDPGHTGALAFFDPLMDALNVHPIPLFNLTKTSGAAKKVVDIQKLQQIILDEAQGRKIIAWVEDVGVRPGEGAVGAFTFGFGAGVLHGVIGANRIRIEKVQPNVWKKAMRCPADKDGARSRASTLFPNHAHLWPLVKDDGKAEASLLALYGSTRS